MKFQGLNLLCNGFHISVTLVVQWFLYLFELGCHNTSGSHLSLPVKWYSNLKFMFCGTLLFFSDILLIHHRSDHKNHMKIFRVLYLRNRR